MKQERLMKILLAPHISEKTMMIEENVVTFRVARDASKPEIKGAVELMFSVKVKAVNVVNVKGKAKRFGATRGKRSDWKKAYVTLAAGHQIDFFSAT